MDRGGPILSVREEPSKESREMMMKMLKKGKWKRSPCLFITKLKFLAAFNTTVEVYVVQYSCRSFSWFSPEEKRERAEESPSL